MVMVEVSSTKAEKVILVLALQEIYNKYGRPKLQISYNGPPLNSRMMTKFENESDIELQNYSTPSIIKLCWDIHETVQILTPKDLFEFCIQNITGVNVFFASTEEVRSFYPMLVERFKDSRASPETHSRHCFRVSQD